MTVDLAARLREGTQQAHTAAENSAFMKCFLKGIVEIQPLRKLLADLYFVYSALEEELAKHADHPIVGLIQFPELNRQAALEEDLTFYYGQNWWEQIRISPAAQTYVSRIYEVSNSEPALLVAHAYVRYMGDLSGGQGLKSIIRSALNLPADRGTSLHEFKALPTVEARRNFKFTYRDRLNELPVDEALAEQIVNEAILAFSLNRDIFHELEPEVKAAIGDHVFELLTRQDRPGSTAAHPRGHAAPELVTAE